MRDHVLHTSVACPTEVALEIVGGKWKLVILEHLVDGVWRFGELQRAMSAVTARMLTRQLRELEADGLVLRTVYPQVPPKVEYSLTDVGRSLEPLLAQLRAWGEWYRQHPSPDASQSAGASRPSEGIRHLSLPGHEDAVVIAGDSDEPGPLVESAGGLIVGDDLEPRVPRSPFGGVLRQGAEQRHGVATTPDVGPDCHAVDAGATPNQSETTDRN